MKSSNQAFIEDAELSTEQRASCRAMSFTVRSPRLLKLQAGIRNAELAQLLKTHHALTAAIVTAYNPAGHKLPLTKNKARHAALATAIKRLKLTSLPAERKTDGNDEAYDAAYLVLNLTGAQAEALLTEFDQHALLWCSQTNPPELMLHPLVRQRVGALPR